MGKYYFGNFPNSSNYDPNVPLGWNKWDEMDNSWDDEYDADEDDDEAPEKEIPDDEEEKELLKP